MDLRHLRSFVAVAETLHFSRAAERLHLVQPAVTQQIQKLEAELGVRLFERGTRSVRLTSVGTEFLREARAAVQQAERARLVAMRAQRGEVGHVELSHASSIAFSGILSRLLRTVAQSAPDLTIGVTEADAEPQIQMLLDGAIDIALLRLPIGTPPRSLVIETLQREAVMACLPSGHPLLDDSIAVHDLAQEDFVATHLREGWGFFDTQLQTCRVAGFEPRIISRSHQFASIVSLVASGRGVALVPESIHRLQLRDVEYRPLRKSTHRSDIAMIWHAERLTPAIQHIAKRATELNEQGMFKPR
ncbi:LysR family transcriptional regulator [Sphingomonas sp. CGMCC 1.13654]|uniref:LysR family transcriptional regulator n=1 Tax=Sphingomonas chungangi TaxID=2683589 RepID=A0A838L6Y3_9SPHN|nr:LysR family transcriptional regulator [Sphingomonas chungangi]MBA2933906.1 LysR family transcriptional regulator [Sphingomonas chungangi]MVW55235.1 LysR family transcriptional regulator [Sphingomonas chungangi]